MDDIQGYTLGMVRGFLRSSRRLEAAREAQWLSLATLAARGEISAVERTLVQLQKEAQVESDSSAK